MKVHRATRESQIAGDGNIRSSKVRLAPSLLSNGVSPPGGIQGRDRFPRGGDSLSGAGRPVTRELG